MDDRNATITTRYFEPRDVSLGEDEIVVVACMRNEGLRLPYFLEYYRALGVNRFLVADNDSTDGTGELLQAQPDVEYFHTTASYRGSGAGRLWNHELAATYAMGRWVLTADVDELLVYPGAQRFGLRTLCRYLDGRGYDGVYAPMIDMYADVPLSQARYEPGTDFLEACPYFDTHTYTLRPLGYPPFLGVTGGPRRDKFAPAVEGLEPWYVKVPLVKWKPGYSYIRSTHTHRALRLADLTGALLHFKFFSTWEDVIERDRPRGDRRSRNALMAYTNSFSDLCFYGPHSRRYRSPRDLAVLGVTAAPDPLKRFYRKELTAAGEDPALVDDLLPEPAPEPGGMTLRSLARVWPLVQNPAVARYYGQDEPRPAGYRKHLVRELARHIEVVDVFADHILVRIQEPALHRWRRSGLALAAYVGGTLAGWVMADGSGPGLEIDTTSFEANVCRWDLDVAGAAARDVGDRTAPISVYVGDAGDPAGTVITTPDESWPRPEDALIFSQEWHLASTSASWEAGITGKVHDFQDGELRGWVYDATNHTFDVPVSVYVNDRLLRYARPTDPRPALVERLGCPPNVVGRGFTIPVPLGYFADAGMDSVRIVVRAAGSNVDLQHTPIEVPSHAREAMWTRRTGWSVSRRLLSRATGRSPARP